MQLRHRYEIIFPKMDDCVAGEAVRGSSLSLGCSRILLRACFPISCACVGFGPGGLSCPCSCLREDLVDPWFLQGLSRFMDASGVWGVVVLPRYVL